MAMLLFILAGIQVHPYYQKALQGNYIINNIILYIETWTKFAGDTLKCSFFKEIFGILIKISLDPTDNMGYLLWVFWRKFTVL